MPKTRHERYQDHVEKLFEEVRARLNDPPTVNRLLIELGRFYDPLLLGGVVDPSTRHHIVDLLRRGRIEDAREILDERIELHNKFSRLQKERESGLMESEHRIG